MADPTLRLDDFLPYRLSYSANLASEVVARAYRALFDLRIPEWRLVAVVAEGDGISQQAIAERTGMDKVTVSRAAIALVRRGLLERAAHARDQRSHLLRLSAAGRRLHAAVAPEALALERRLFAAFSAAEKEQLVDLLRRVDAAAAAMA